MGEQSKTSKKSTNDGALYIPTRLLLFLIFGGLLGCVLSGIFWNHYREKWSNARDRLFQREPEVAPLSCTIRSEPTWGLHESPEVMVTLTNLTDADIYLVKELDGSETWRYPHCYLEVTGPDGKSDRRGHVVCRSVGTIQVSDFAKVAPGGTFDPYQGKGIEFQRFATPGYLWKPGEYRIRFVYSTKSDAISEWVVDLKHKKIVDLFRKVPKVEVRSNEITVTIAELPPIVAVDDPTEAQTAAFVSWLKERGVTLEYVKYPEQDGWWTITEPKLAHYVSFSIREFPARATEYQMHQAVNADRGDFLNATAHLVMSRAYYGGPRSDVVPPEYDEESEAEVRKELARLHLLQLTTAEEVERLFKEFLGGEAGVAP